ncbi:MAG: class I SAM-dependent RNA methyltransferase [bacterium]|nr:class I SAM-dependent RNA methyltransferase [bacterium]
MFEFEEKERYFAQTGRGLEPLARTELEELGAVNCSEGYRGVYFGASLETMYRINYCARLITRVLAPLISFKCHSDKVLYKKAYDIPWSEILSIEKTFAVFAAVANSNIKHSQFAGLRLKDAVADYFRKQFGKRPNVDTENPDVWLNVNIHNDRAVISLDTSGGSLHRRGYRKATVTAPAQETLAAAMIRLSGWPQGVGEDRETPPLLDPMCGSGTILAEALMAYCRIPAAFKRERFGFFHLPGFDFKSWADVKSECDRRIRECPSGLISGSDISKDAVEASVLNLKEIPGGYRIPVRRRDFREIRKAENHIIVTNPPYGVRMSEREKLQVLFKEMGDFLKQRCVGSTAYILAGSKELSKHLGLRISRRTPLFNGPLEVRLIKVDAY